jgi:PPM family protein phosphatase
MGTTVTVALVDAPAGEVRFGHVGDSRAYRLRDGILEQVTTDHSLVAELVESGVLTPEEAERHPQRSAITRALGTEADVDADIFTIEAEPGDLFLLCSDGLSDMLSEDEIAAAIESAGRDPKAAGEALVAAANASGGEDNIPVVLFELVDTAAPEEEAAEDQKETADADAETVAGAEADGAPTAELSRHGAGPGGRIAALALIAAVLVIALIGVYLAVLR